MLCGYLQSAAGLTNHYICAGKRNLTYFLFGRYAFKIGELIGVGNGYFYRVAGFNAKVRINFGALLRVKVCAYGNARVALFHGRCASGQHAKQHAYRHS